ncbi:hypothetical protein B0H14DRAFT_3650100, partial [Mycena olivaceomarginata]
LRISPLLPSTRWGALGACRVQLGHAVVLVRCCLLVVHAVHVCCDREGFAEKSMWGAGRADREKRYERADAAPHPLRPCIARRLGAWMAVRCPSPVGGAPHRHGRERWEGRRKAKWERPSGESGGRGLRVRAGPLPELHGGLTAAGGASCAESDHYVLGDCETFTATRATGERRPGGRGRGFRGGIGGTRTCRQSSHSPHNLCSRVLPHPLSFVSLGDSGPFTSPSTARHSPSLGPPSRVSRRHIRPLFDLSLNGDFGAWRPIRHLPTPSHSHLRFSSPWVPSRSRSNLSHVPPCIWVALCSRYGAFTEADLVAVLPPISFFGQWILDVSGVLVVVLPPVVGAGCCTFAVGQ